MGAMMAYDPELVVYEEPGSLDVDDWERFCQQMREEARRHPESQHVRLTLQSAERALKQCRAMRARLDAQAA